MLLAALQSIEVPPQVASSARSPEGAKAGLLFRQGLWDEAHRIAQDLETPEGSFWHGILHRNEGDWSNAGYWFRRVAAHPIYLPLREDAASVLARYPGTGWNLGSTWDPIRFIKWCEEAVATKNSTAERVVIEIQVAEWTRLFRWCME